MRIYNLTDNDDVAIVAQQGIFQVMEWKRGISSLYKSFAMPSHQLDDIGHTMQPTRKRVRPK